jgi:hypothetical protein
MPMLFAAPTTAPAPSTTLGENLSPDTLMNSIIGSILTIFRYIGVILLCWSIGQLVLAFKDGDGNSKTQAAMMVVVSILLIGLKTFLEAVGLIGG